MVVDWIDERGIQRRSVVPNSEANPAEGVPKDVFDLLDVFLHETPITFRRKFYGYLWAFELIEPQDYATKNAHRKVRQALNSAVSRDATDIIRYLDEELTP